MANSHTQDEEQQEQQQSTTNTATNFLASPPLRARQSQSPTRIQSPSPHRLTQQQRDPTPKGLNRTSTNSSSSHTHRRVHRSPSTSNKKSPVIFPHRSKSSAHSSPRANQSTLSRTSSLHSTFSEAAYRSSNCNSPTSSSQPLSNIGSPCSNITANAAITNPNNSNAFSSNNKKSSRHPSFSYHGLEGKGSTGSHVQKPDYSEAKIVVAMVSFSLSLLSYLSYIHQSPNKLSTQVGLPARGKSYLSNKLQRYLKVSQEDINHTLLLPTIISLLLLLYHSG
jgi:hypothetical protein